MTNFMSTNGTPTYISFQNNPYFYENRENRGQTTFKRLGLPGLRLLKRTVVCPCFSLVIGMIIAAKITRRFELRTISFSVIPRHLLAGTLMGIGGSMAAGGNDTQLLAALPSLSPAGIVTVLSMIAGIYSVNFILKPG